MDAPAGRDAVSIRLVLGTGYGRVWAVLVSRPVVPSWVWPGVGNGVRADGVGACLGRPRRLEYWSGVGNGVRAVLVSRPVVPSWVWPGVGNGVRADGVGACLGRPRRLEYWSGVRYGV